MFYFVFDLVGVSPQKVAYYLLLLNLAVLGVMLVDKNIVATMVSKKRVLVPAACVYVLVMVNFLRGKSTELLS